MNLIREVAAELADMFVGDARLSLATLVVIAAAAAVCLAGLPPLLGGGVLLAGSLAAFFDSVRRAAQARR